MTQSLHFWSNFDSPFLPEDGPNQKKKKSIWEKLWPSVYPNIEKAKLYLLSHLREKYNYFFPCLGYLWLEKRKSESKFDIPYWSLAIPGQFNIKNVVPALSSFPAIGTKEYSSVKFSPNFQVWLLLWLPRLQV